MPLKELNLSFTRNNTLHLLRLLFFQIPGTDTMLCTQKEITQLFTLTTELYDDKWAHQYLGMLMRNITDKFQEIIAKKMKNYCCAVFELHIHFHINP